MRTTTTPSRLIRVLIAVCASLVLVSSLASPALGENREGNVTPPKAYYLSLGDSMGFGLQFDRLFEMLDAGTYTPDAFNTGYTDVLTARMRRLRPNQQTVNLTCPGESTTTMINGGCEYSLPEPDGPGLALHTDYEGSQLDAAVSFLRSHRRQVNPITISIGGIDAGDTFADRCNFDAACIERSGLRSRLDRGLDRILGTLASRSRHRDHPRRLLQPVRDQQPGYRPFVAPSLHSGGKGCGATPTVCASPTSPRSSTPTTCAG